MATSKPTDSLLYKTALAEWKSARAAHMPTIDAYHQLPMEVAAFKVQAEIEQAVREHLARYLPSHPMHPEERKRSGIGAISAAPYGSAGVLPISWAYIRLMGAAGLTRATATAVLSANYIAQRLEEHFPVLYRGHGGLVAHECIIDLRPITKETGVTVDDVAKRLIDYGFHAPTMSFPVAGTLMVEPTESEDLPELDRFIEAMVASKSVV